MQNAIADLADATRAYLQANADLLNLTPQRIASIQPVCAVTPASVSAVSIVQASLPDMSEDTRAMCEAVQTAAPFLHWRQTYTQADGFSQAFLDTYGWFDLVGPEGPYTADGLRIMFGYWGPGLHYPDHSHVQEEHYVVLGGSAWFRLGAEAYRRLGPGEIFHTPPNAIHAAQMRDEPLLAMAVWRAEDLTVRIHLTDADRRVEV